ncbi:MAG: DUF4844 domain-containing protein [Steroidobacteraceae bacterium]
MSVDLTSVIGFPLRISDDTVARLLQIKRLEKFTDLPGPEANEERRRCSVTVDELIDRLVEGIVQNPRKSWVLEQFVPTLRAACAEDTEARERFGPYFEQIMNVFGIESSDGMLTYYLAFGGDDAA